MGLGGEGERHAIGGDQRIKPLRRPQEALNASYDPHGPQKGETSTRVGKPRLLRHVSNIEGISEKKQQKKKNLPRKQKEKSRVRSDTRGHQRGDLGPAAAVEKNGHEENRKD